jgi:hypothetical protein
MIEMIAMRRHLNIDTLLLIQANYFVDDSGEDDRLVLTHKPTPRPTEGPTYSAKLGECKSGKSQSEAVMVVAACEDNAALEEVYHYEYEEFDIVGYMRRDDDGRRSNSIRFLGLWEIIVETAGEEGFQSGL